MTLMAAPFLLVCIFSALGLSSAATLSLHNRCSHTIWPGIQPSSGKPTLAHGGFELRPNKAVSIGLPAGWSGRIWGRQNCAFDPSGRGRCATGDCGGSIHCNGRGGAPPATLAEITLGEKDFYDVSLVDGYNLAMSIKPFGAKSGKCGEAGCVSDLNVRCPSELQVRGGRDNHVLACKSACSAFGSAKYCCTGAYGNAQKCKPNSYSHLFKEACPRAYSYAFDDPTSTFTCVGGSYLVTFCPQN